MVQKKSVKSLKSKRNKITRRKRGGNTPPFTVLNPLKPLKNNISLPTKPKNISIIQGLTNAKQDLTNAVFQALNKDLSKDNVNLYNRRNKGKMQIKNLPTRIYTETGNGKL